MRGGTGALMVNTLPGMGRRAQKNRGHIVVKEHVIKRFPGVLESECCPAVGFHQDMGEKFLLAFAFHQGK